jgi:pimeloyl-ACP methyl ester carboxylesterase
VTSKTTVSNKRDKRYWRNLLIFGIFGLVVACLFIQFGAYPYLSAYGHSHPQRSLACCETPADFGLDFEDFEITTSDNLILQGWFIPPQNGAVIILLHGLGGNRKQMLEPAIKLAQQGFGLLMPDMRVHGESEGDVFPYGGPEAEDVRAAVAYLKSRTDVNPEAIGVMGWSLGAQVGILSAALIPEIRSVIADGPGAIAFDDWPPPQNLEESLYVPLDFVYYRVLPWNTGVKDPISLSEALPLIAPRSIMIISSGNETEWHRLEYLFDFAEEPKEFWVIPEAGHLGGWQARPEEYKTKIVDFFSLTLLENND